MDSPNFPTFARTDFKTGGTKFEHEKTIPLIWEIENVSFRKWGRDKICGPEFKFHPLRKESWKLEIRSKRENDWAAYDGLLIDIIKVSKCKSAALQFTVTLSVNSDGSLFLKHSVNIPANTRHRELFDSTITSSFGSYFHGNDLCDMIIQIEIDHRVSRRDLKAADYRSALDQGKLGVLADMESILNEAEFTDIALRSEGKEIRAHRAILAGRSAVFKNMLQHQMSERASGLVDISDVPYDTLQMLVAYLYSGKLGKLDMKSALELFAASNKYAIEDLHSTCSLFLKRSLTVESCLEILMLADLHSHSDLKTSAVAYFSLHSKEIWGKNPDWKNVIKARPTVAYELLKVLALKS